MKNRIRRIYDLFRQALNGSEKEYTSGSIDKAIFLLSIPMVLEMVMEGLFALVDIFFVSKLGKEATATVGLTEVVMTQVVALALGLSMATTAMVARRIGEKDREGASVAAMQAIIIGIICCTVIAIIFYFTSEDILRFMGGSEELIRTGNGYTRLLLTGSSTLFFLFLLNAIFRGAGDAAIAMRVLILANGLNMILSPVFIFGVGPFPELGVTGAAVGTTIGRGIGVAYAAWHLFRPGGRIHVSRASWMLDTELLARLVKLSSTAVFRLLVATASWTALMPIVAAFGEVAIAGYVIALRVVMFALLPALGLSNAAATMVGQNLGAGKPERSESAVWKAAGFNTVLYFLIGAVFWLFSAPIIGIFTQEPEVFAYGTSALHIIAYGFAFYGLGMVLETAFNGAGDTWTPTYLNIFVFWLFEIPLAYLLAYYFEMGPSGVFWAITIAFSVLAIASAILFKRGKWKLKKV